MLSLSGLLLAASLASCQDDDVPTPERAVLTESETATLRFMREEEKLARDVYTYLGSKYALPIFSNIASSEQRHVDFVLDVMDQYDVEDIATDTPGAFTLPALQDLYRSLTAKGELSLLDALWVGATIEDMDINDLNEAIKATENADLIDLYELLRCGSENHLRGFNGQIEWNGGTYTPVYITQDEFDAIIAGSHASCIN